MENKTVSREGALPINTILSGRYTIERVIGEGGFGITYEARHNQLGSQMAIKEFFIAGKCVRQEDGLSVAFQGIKPELFEKYRKRFHDEARTLFRLNNAHVVHVHDIFDENGTTYIVMDFVSGENLQEKIEREGTLSYDVAVNIMAQLCEAVAHIHERHILHRDIKPDNIIITPQNNVVLIDFGSARGFVHDQEQRHTAMVTMGYAPIEQYSSTSKKGNYSDIYAVGGVFYFILTGKRPDVATDRMLNDELMPPHEMNNKIPLKASETIMKALNVKPEDRYQNVSEFVDDLLGGVTQQLEEPINSQEVMPISASSNKKKLIIVIVLGVLLVVVGGVGIGIAVRQRMEKQKIEQLRIEYGTRYESLCSKCDEHLRMVDEDKFFFNFMEIARDLREMQSYEAQAPFATLGIDARSNDYMQAYRDKMNQTSKILEEELQEEKYINDSPENTRLQNLSDKIDLLNNLWEQTQSGDASKIILPEDKK